jgi:Ca2+-dependent lipid-binding protein
MVVKVVHARELNAGKGVTPDPYCTITYPGGVENKTDAISSTVNPVWN